VVAWLPDGPVAFEYQTPGSNDPKILTEKRKSGESKYGRLFFVGNIQSVREIEQAIGTKEIVYPRGSKLEGKIKELLGETTCGTGRYLKIRNESGKTIAIVCYFLNCIRLNQYILSLSTGATVFNGTDLFAVRVMEKRKKTEITRAFVCFFMLKTGAFRHGINQSI